MAGIINSNGQILIQSGTVTNCGLNMGTANTGWYLGNGLTMAVNGVNYCEFPGSGVAAQVSVSHPTSISGNNVTNIGDSTLRWSATWSVNGTVHTSHSDFKNDIQDLPLTISVPRGISYKWKDTEGTDKDRTYIGFLADDLPKEAFLLDDNGQPDHRAVKTSAVIGILCSKVRELETLCDTLEVKVNTLKTLKGL